MNKLIYVSTDIEADGPCPGKFSMLSLASAAFIEGNETPISTYTVNIETLPGASTDPDTAKFWERNPEAYVATRVDTKSPEQAMGQYSDWVSNLDGKPIFVGYPASFDSLFVFWYLHMFAGACPFGWQALDMKSYASATLGVPFTKATKKNFPKSWFSGLPHTHVALDDAKEQGVTFLRMLEANKRLVVTG